MDITAQLRVLEAAQGDPAKLALVTVDLAYPELNEAERAGLKLSLEVAAIPHWCDENILAAMLEISPQEGAARLARLKKLTVLEPFPARGDNAVNVHEATRLALRKAMAANGKERFQSLSTRAAAIFVSDRTPTGRIEWIYHSLCGDPDRGATELEKMNREWERSANTEDRYALAATLEELEKTLLVEGRARLWTLMGIAWVRNTRGEAAQLMEMAAETLRLARATGDQPAEADAQCLIGDVLQAQTRLSEASVAFIEYQAITQRLAAQDPTNERQAALAAAHNRVGGVLEAQNKLPQALDAFAKSLAVMRSLVKKEPSNWGWQRELAAAHSRLGDVLRGQGELAEAQVAFTDFMTIAQELVKHNPRNTEWQSDLAMAHSLIGDIMREQDKLPEAQAAFEEYLTIGRRLVEQEPTNSRWRQLLAVAHGRIGGVLQSQGKPAEARAEFEEALAIDRRLAEQNLDNTGWQRDLAVVCLQVARLDAEAGKRSDALKLYEEATRIFGAVVEKSPEIAQWAQERKTAEIELLTYRAQLSTGEQSS
jgi:tetratricopeptide (TPR) repeat protein